MSEAIAEVAAPEAAPSAPAPSAAPLPAPTGPDPSIAAREAAATAELEKSLSEVWDKAQVGDDDASEPAPGPVRGPDGKFLAKPADPNSPAPQVKPAAPEGTSDQPNPEAPPADVAAADAPKWWSQELQAKFKTLPPDVAKSIGEQALSDRQTISKLGNTLQSYEPLGRVINEHMADFEAVGVNPVQGIQQLLQAQQKLANPATRAEAYRFLLQNFPADLSQFGIDAMLPPDPQLEAQNQRMSQLERRIADYERREKEAASVQAEHKYKSALTTIDQLAKTLPHFDDVLPDIRLLMPSILEQDPSLSQEAAIKLAHESAVWANPKTRALMQKAEVEKQAKAQLEAADKARRANALNVASKQRSATPADLDEALGNVWDKHHAA